MRMLISLSILDYEADLSNHISNLQDSITFSKIVALVKTGKFYTLHVDVMRPPMIPDQTRFSTELLETLYRILSRDVSFAFHLMVDDPFPIISKINGFVSAKDRPRVFIVVQRESFILEKETVQTLKLLKKYGYKAGICLNLLTPNEKLSRKIVEEADMVLFMSVPMGRGGQKYSDEATRRVSDLSSRFPCKLIEVDGGIDSHTIATTREAGAKLAVVGSFITRSENPSRALEKLERTIENNKN